MAELLSDADVGFGAPQQGAMSDADVGLAAPENAQFKGVLGGLKEGIVNAPSEAWDLTKQRASQVASDLNPFSDERRKNILEGGASGSIDNWLKTGRGLLTAAGLPFTPIEGALRSIIGTPMTELTHTTGEYVAPELAAKDVREKMLEQSKGDVSTALSALAPGRRAPASMVPIPPRPTPTGPLGVTLSEGQLTRELPLIREEQAALRGQRGPQAEEVAKEFMERQQQQVSAAQENVSRELDPFSMRVAETPQEAGELVSQGIQNAAAQRKTAVTQAYDYAKSLPGEINAGVFEGMGQKIKGELSLRDDPVIIDDKLTPFADRALKDVEDRISKLIIKNRADPFGPPNPENVVGVDLKGVEQMRKRLSAFRKDAYGSGNAADGRAAKAVIDAFDNHIDDAVNSGMFSGDQRAIQAWNDARAAHSDYMGTFKAGKNDPVGRVVEKILGKNNNPAAIPNDVADFMYGASGVNPSSLNVNVAKRVRGILGDRSPEWSAVKQGLFSRLTEAGPGVTDWGPAKQAQRINKFLSGDGKELAETLFSPAERLAIQKYADLQRSLEIPPSGVNRSETSTFMAPMLKKLGTSIAYLVGAAVGHTVAPGLYGAGELIGGALVGKGSTSLTNAANARKIARQMPLIENATKQWQKAVNAANRKNSGQTRAAQAIATANLARVLKPIGLSLESIGMTQGVIPSHAEEEKP